VEVAMSDDADGQETGGGATGGSGPGDEADFSQRSPEPGELLGEVRAIRRKARLTRHAYWFPLVLFGLLTLASIPFYVQSTGPGLTATSNPLVRFLGNLGGFGGPAVSSAVAYYWVAAILLGVAATAVWYRWRGDRVGLRTPARGYLIAGVVLLALGMLIPVLPGDLVIRGTFPFVLIALGLCVLAWAERSVALMVIAICYLGLSLVASLYDIVNLLYRMGWNLSPSASLLPNVVLPALLLLLCGLGAWLVQRQYGGPAARAVSAEAGE
jgi:hypothetical protein